MLTDLDLHGKELMAYAIIYGFSQDGAGWFVGGRSYVAEWIGCNDKTAGALLKSMTDKGLLVRREAVTDTGKTYRYQAVAPRAKNAHTSGENEPTMGEKRPTPRAKNAHITTKEDYNEDYKRESKGRFATPTRDDVLKYAREKGYSDITPNEADRFIAYYESNGWMVGRNKMKNWRAAVTNWHLRNNIGSNQQRKEPEYTPPDGYLESLLEYERNNFGGAS